MKKITLVAGVAALVAAAPAHAQPRPDAAPQAHGKHVTLECGRYTNDWTHPMLFYRDLQGRPHLVPYRSGMTVTDINLRTATIVFPGVFHKEPC